MTNFIKFVLNHQIYGNNSTSLINIDSSHFSKLINKSVRGTVDLRALTKTPPLTASKADIMEAIEENMILVVESARAIGCAISDGMEIQLVNGDHTTIDKLILELIRVSIYNLMVVT